MGDKADPLGDTPLLQVLRTQTAAINQRWEERLKDEHERWAMQAEDYQGQIAALVAERGALAARLAELTAVLGYIAGWSPGTSEADGAAYNNGVDDTARRFRKMARDALKD